MPERRKSSWCCCCRREFDSRAVDEPRLPPVDYNDAFAWLEESIRRFRDPEFVQPWILCAEDLNAPFPNTVIHRMQSSTLLVVCCRE